MYETKWSNTHVNMNTSQTHKTHARKHTYIMYYIYIIYTLLFCLFILYLYKIGTLTDDSYLVSVDVRSLYSNIIHIEGIEAVTKSLQKSKHFYISISIITFLKLLLTLNSLIFNGVNYLQKKERLCSAY